MTLPIAALGLAGEAGEVADEVKKIVGHGKRLNAGKLAEEIGDVLYYCAAACDVLELSLAGVAADNIVKLRKRYPDGFRRMGAQP